MIAFETSVAIDRPREQVFAYVADPVNFPSWNSAVLDVRPTTVGANGPRLDLRDDAAATEWCRPQPT